MVGKAWAKSDNVWQETRKKKNLVKKFFNNNNNFEEKMCAEVVT